MNTQRKPVQLGALLASMAMTALLIGSQLGLADHYTTQADAMLAAKRSAPVAQAASAGVPAPRREI